jgi:signal transduction histidine kinase/CheY-like chemotaxis protein
MRELGKWAHERDILDILSKYLGKPQEGLSLQTICDDVRILSRSAFVALNLYTQHKTLKTVVVSGDIHGVDIPLLMSENWDHNSFVTATTHSNFFIKTPSTDKNAFNPGSYVLHCTGIFDGNHSIGSFILGVDSKAAFSVGDQTAYFIKQSAKFIPLFLEKSMVQETNDVISEISAGYFKKIISQVPGIIFSVKIDPSGNSAILALNEKGKYQGLKNLGDLFRLVHPEDFDILIREFEHSKTQITNLNVEFRIKTFDAEDYAWHKLQAKPEKDQDDNLIFYSYLSPINELKESQLNASRAIEESQKANNAKAEFLSSMSHEIRTPMNAILGFSELLVGNTKGPKYESYLNGVISGGKNLLMLINDVLDLAKIESGKMEIHYFPTDIHKVVQEFYQIYLQEALKKDITFFIENNLKSSQMIMIDEVKLKQILFNLLGNAFKYTSSGEISLSLNVVTDEQDKKRTNLVIKVKDTGIGIPANQQKIIFESFRQQQGQSTRKYGGTGLGLTITKFFVEAMNGSIALDSKENKGSTFTIVFKDIATVSHKPIENKTLQSANIIFKGQTVLIVEDISSNVEILKGFLEDKNLTTLQAENGEIALKLVALEKPDLILMDMMMPVMNGYEATRILKSDERYKNIPVVATTASALKHNEQLISNLCDSYLRKPIVREELIQVIANYLAYDETQPEMITVEKKRTAYNFACDVKKKLLNKFGNKYSSISDLMSIDDISSFAEELREYSREVQDQDLYNYGEDLFQHTENFEIDQMNELFKKFRKLIGMTTND